MLKQRYGQIERQQLSLSIAYNRTSQSKVVTQTFHFFTPATSQWETSLTGKYNGVRLTQTWTKVQWGNHIADLVANGEDPSIGNDIIINHHHKVEATEIVRESIETFFWSNEEGTPLLSDPILEAQRNRFTNLIMKEMVTGGLLGTSTFTTGHLWGTLSMYTN